MISLAVAGGHRARVQLPVAMFAAATAVAVAYGVSVAPVLTVAALLAVAGVVVVTASPLAATGLLGMSFFFDGYLSNSGAGFLTPGKAVGILAVGAWAASWAVGKHEIRTSPHLWVICGFATVLALSLSAAQDSSSAVLTTSRYAMFFVLFFLVQQAVRERAQADVLLDMVIAAAGIASLLGVLAYLSGQVGRASGPTEDPGDFGFLLACTVPLALYRLGSAPAARRLLAGASLLVMFAAILTTFSRASLIGLAVAGAWALGTRRLRVRWGVLALVALLAAAGVTYLTQPELVRTTLEQKQNIGDRNVDTRLVFWQVALDQFGTSPVVGVGPGGYVSRFTEFHYPYEHEVTTTHNAYLNVLAELGAPGLALFLLFLLMSWLRLRRRMPDPDDDHLMGALAAGFLVAVVGAMFMTQQFYPPIWFLAALAVALTQGDRVRSLGVAPGAS